jgi:hypothetical protein
VAAVALAGPWRRDPLGPPGVIAAVTLGVIGLGLMTGSRLMLETPFGLNVLEAGRFYGLGNNAVVIYAASGIFCAAWLGGILLRRGESERNRALLVMAAVAVFTVTVAAWPGFGAKVGGTIAMLPGFLVLILAVRDKAVREKAAGDKAAGDKAAGDKGNGDKGKWLTWPRAALIGVSGLALVTVFALVNYFVPVTGHSDIGGFVGQLLHGGADATVQRKIGSNLGSLTANPFNLVIPVVVAGLGAIVAWPIRLHCPLVARAYRQIPVLKPALAAVWLTAALGWFAEDSGVTVPAAALPFVLPLMVVILSSLPAEDRKAEDRKAEDQKAEDQKAEDQKAEDQKQAGAGQSAPQGQLESVSSQRQATAGGHPSA